MIAVSPIDLRYRPRDAPEETFHVLGEHTPLVSKQEPLLENRPGVLIDDDRWHGEDKA